MHSVRKLKLILVPSIKISTLSFRIKYPFMLSARDAVSNKHFVSKVLIRYFTLICQQNNYFLGKEKEEGNKFADEKDKCDSICKKMSKKLS